VFPRAIGVVTSPQAAALRDTLKILAQRMPAIPVIVYPTPVQGGGAARSIATMIATASARCECDVLIVCRGGGSLEDLWAFNDEGVARAIHACSMAVVTGIGHETDFTIADFVADLRAPTPSAAAQVVCPDRHELQRMRAEQARALARAMRRSLERRMQQLDYLGRCLVDPRERLQAELQRLQHLASRLTRAATARVVHARWALRDCARQLLLARFDPAERSAQLQRASLRLDAATARAERARSAALDNLSARLETLNPRAVLARGYAIAADRAGRIVRDSAQIRVGEPLTVQFARGSAETEVRTIDLGAADAQMRDRR
jgi:exodeoxyribonuclease VII large subunit